MTATLSKFSFAVQKIPIASMASLLELSSKIEMARFRSEAINRSKVRPDDGDFCAVSDSTRYSLPFAASRKVTSPVE